MEDSIRACIALIAAGVVKNRLSDSVYDYAQSKHVSISGRISGKNVEVYDYDRKCHVSGTLPDLYDYGRKRHVSLEMKDNKFSGYDYGQGKHFEGSVSGNSISIYDYGCSSYYSYSV